MAGPGRETKYDDRRAKKILSDLRAGNTRKCASARAGITERTFQRWMVRAKSGEEPFASFSSAVKKAERDAEAGHVANIKLAGKKNWTASAWMLERKWPEDWSANRAEIKQLREEMTAVLAELRAIRGAGKPSETSPQSGEADGKKDD